MNNITLFKYYLLTLFISVQICAVAPLCADKNQDWPLYGRTADNQRFSPLRQINADNIKKLTLAWRYNTGKPGTFQTSPIIEDGVMYLTTPFNHVIALNAQTGERLWHYEHALKRKKFCCGPANRGPAVTDNYVYTVTIDARLLALDKKTGAIVWDVEIVDTEVGQAEELRSLPAVSELSGAVQTGQTGYTANLAPQVHAGKVFVGITGAGYGLHMDIEEDGEQVLSVGGLSGGGHGLRGFLVAYEGATGKELWRWYSVPSENWSGEWTETTAWPAILNVT